MFKSLSIFIVALFMTTAVNGATPRRQLIDDNWQFKLLSPDSTAGNADAWTNVDLPHDWSITRDFKADYPSGNDGGYVITGRGLYRKNLNIPAADAGKRHYLYLEGAYMDAKVTVNGDSVGRRPYGYSSVIYEITPQLHPGDNLIEVDVDNSRQKNCRWFSGSGIYRHVWLLTTPEVNIKPWSLYVTTPKVSAASANANVTFDIDNASDKAHTITPSVTVTDSEGKVVATRTGKPVTASARQVTPCTMELTIDKPSLWSPDTPALYNLTVSLAADGDMIDSVDEHFGVRTFEYSADKGLTLNGKSIVLNGGCAHHDNGVLGAS
ncbi:glycoside hydrolase family 2 protein, partial [uncultured Muribaculum sp.]